MDHPPHVHYCPQMECKIAEQAVTLYNASDYRIITGYIRLSDNRLSN